MNKHQQMSPVEMHQNVHVFRVRVRVSSSVMEGADAGLGSAPRRRAGSAPLSPVRIMRRLSLRILSELSLCKPGNVPPPAVVNKHASVRFVRGYRTHRCGGRPAQILTWMQRCGWRSLAMAQPRKPGDIRLGWRTSCASDKERGS